MTFVRTRAALLALALLVFPFSASVSADGPQPDFARLKARLHAERIAPIDAAPAPGQPLDRAAPDASRSMSQGNSALATDSRAVFQSFRDGNWEVYRANGDFSGQNNATGHPAADIRPELSFNGQKIAFASNRTGNFEIFVMNWDGSGLQQLTNTPDIDTSPTFGPDGQIAFVSDRSGNFEVYTMGSGGENLRRITFTTADEYGPAWSLDGRMAWAGVSSTGGQGIAYIANPDGTNAVAVAQLPYLGSPVWSPDGTTIAFDGDYDGDFWNELLIYNGSIQVAYKPERTFVDAWAGTWLTSTNTIAFTRIEYGVDGQSLVKLASYIETAVIFQNQTTRLTSTARDELPNWRWNDTSPPWSRIRPQADWDPIGNGSYDPGGWLMNGTTVAWQGQDDGASGLYRYDVQYKTGPNGAWQQWLSTSNTAANFWSATLGAQVSFRTRARDRAGNVEAWPTRINGDVTVSVYAWGWSAQVSDNRNVPLANVTLSVSPAPLNAPVLSNNRGGVQTYYANVPPGPSADVGIYTVTYQTPAGFHALPQSRYYAFIGPQSIHASFYGQDNVIRNGDFENGLAEWQHDEFVRVAGSPELKENNTGLLGAALPPLQAITQTVTIPANIHRPTLSFVTTGGSAVQVVISDGVASTIAHTGPLAWRGQLRGLEWVDMSSWSGRTITLTLLSFPTQEAATVFVDDIALSSWLTPVPLDMSIRAAEVTSQPLNVIITGTNILTGAQVKLGSMTLTQTTVLDEAHVSATIPAGIPPGVLNLTIVNPGGQSSTLQNAFHSGKRVLLPVVAVAQ